jgi:methyl-accepting chemotaxis protein
MNDEEEQLESIATQVARISYTAGLINREVDEQTRLLDTIGKQAQSTGELTDATRRQAVATEKESEFKTIFICCFTIFLISILVFLFRKIQ